LTLIGYFVHDQFMGAGLGSARTASPLTAPCQLVVRRQEGPSEFLRFMLEGLEVGQQVVVLAGATCLTNLARALNESGLQAQALLRSGRLLFLTAPDCLAQLTKKGTSLPQSPLRRRAPIVRWVSDWSWAYAQGHTSASLLDYQHRVHELVRSLEALSVCTVHSAALERRVLLAVLADHRRAARSPLPGDGVTSSRGSSVIGYPQ
jgi:MEDS: MEthanogen/methylotroph, DcmR Sensory domain